MQPEVVRQFRSLPRELWRAAKRKLAGEREAQVSLTSGGKLARWAAGERAEDRRKAVAQEYRRLKKMKLKSKVRRAMQKATRRAQR